MSNTNQIRAIIIDDSFQAVKLLRLMIQELLPNVILLGEAENVAKGFELIESLKPDVLFLDIEMPGKTGIQLAEELIAKNINCQIIFTTAYNSYAIKAFRLSAIDYLLKPIQENQLIEAVQKVEEHLNLKQENERLSVLAKNLSSDKLNSLVEIDLQNIKNQQYIGDVFIGQPAQPIKVQFDTGSSAVYLITDSC